jgi:transcriptional regulator with XRE-family HTH domain
METQQRKTQSGGETDLDSRARKARINAGLSIEEAARKLGISGGYLSQIETGKRNVTRERADKIAELYQVKRDEIFLPSRYAIREVVEAGDTA